MMWEQEKKGHGKELAAGFVPAPSNKVHPKCLKQMQKYCREAKKRQAPVSTPQEEETQEEQPQKKQKEMPSPTRMVELQKTGALDTYEKEIFLDFALRDIAANGDGTLKLHGQRGRPQTFMKVTMAEAEEPSNRTRERRTREMAAHVEAVNARLRNSYKTRRKMYLDFARSRKAREAGLTLAQKLKQSNDDIDYAVSYLGLSLYGARKFIKMGKHRFGWKFGQTIDEHRAGKKARRLPTLYTTEDTVQPDGTTKPVIYKRVEDIGNFLANKISQLKIADRFKAWDVGDHVPAGAVIVSPVVCKNTENKSKSKSTCNHKHRAHIRLWHYYTPTCAHPHTYTQIDLGGPVHKNGLQIRNTDRPGSTDQCFSVGEIRRPRPKNVSYKIDNERNCNQLVNYTSPDSAFGLATSLADQMHGLDDCCIAKFGDEGSHHYSCLPLDSWQLSENLNLTTAVIEQQDEDHHQCIDWDKVSVHVPTRTSKECQQRWVEHLDSRVARTRGTDTGTLQFADFAYCPVNSKIGEKDAICIPSSCLEGAGEDDETAFMLGIDAVAESAGKWVPFVKDGMITHFGKVQQVRTWRDMEMCTEFQNRAPMGPAADAVEAVAAAANTTAAAANTTAAAAAAAADVDAPTTSPSTTNATTTRVEQTDHSCWPVFNEADTFGRVLEYLPRRSKDRANLKQTCMDNWRAIDSTTLLQNSTSTTCKCPSFTKYTYTLQLKIKHLKEVHPPLPLPGYQGEKVTDVAVPFPSAICNYHCAVVSVEGSDIMGFNVHRGKQGGGNQTCMCPFCNVTRSQFQTDNIKGEPGTWQNYDKWFWLYQKIGLKQPGRRANVHKRALFVPKHASPCPLHLMLGNTNTWRKIIKLLCQIVDGENVNKAKKQIVGLLKNLAKCKKSEDNNQKKLNAAVRELTKCVIKCRTHFDMTPEKIIKLTPAAIEETLGETTPFKKNQAKKAAAALTKAMEAHQCAGEAQTTTKANFDAATTEHDHCARQLEKAPASWQCRNTLMMSWESTRRSFMEVSSHKHTCLALKVHSYRQAHTHTPPPTTHTRSHMHHTRTILQLHQGDWQGNQCKRFLGIITKKDEPKDWKDVLVHLKEQIMNSNLESKPPLIEFIDKVFQPLCGKLVEVVEFICKIKPMGEQEIENGCEACVDYVRMFREKMHIGIEHPLLQQAFHITPKMHILEAHVPDFARKWRTVGFFGEDVVETLHKDYNSLIRRFSSIRKVEDQMVEIDDAKNLQMLHPNVTAESTVACQEPAQEATSEERAILRKQIVLTLD